MPAAVLFDVDGTLVDTNYLHVVAWAEAFRIGGYDVAMSDLHALIGQGSDRLVDSVLGHGDDTVVDAHADLYGARLHTLRAFEGAATLLRRTSRSGALVVLATSASGHDDDVIDHVSTSDDADASKPAPDIVESALSAAGKAAADCVFVGDSVWDVKAAIKAGMPCVCVETGGIGAAVLRDAGAVAVYPHVAALLADFDNSILAGGSGS
jgi:phosphoglycolate phosphatase-like HAD superfamily hydrolase